MYFRKHPLLPTDRASVGFAALKKKFKSNDWGGFRAYSNNSRILSPRQDGISGGIYVTHNTFMIRRSFQDLSKSAFIPLYGALVRPHLEYDLSACSPNLVADINHLERIQRLATRLV